MLDKKRNALSDILYFCTKERSDNKDFEVVENKYVARTICGKYICICVQNKEQISHFFLFCKFTRPHSFILNFMKAARMIVCVTSKSNTIRAEGGGGGEGIYLCFLPFWTGNLVVLYWPV